MKRQKDREITKGSGLVVFILFWAIFMLVMPVYAAVDCNNLADELGDFDNDGLRNGEECGTFTQFVDGSPVPSLDPNTMDVFVILNPADPSLLPSEPFGLVSQTPSGLILSVHQITKDQANTDRTVLVRADNTKVRAAQISESLEPATETDTKLGTAVLGFIIDKATVYTQRIDDTVDAVCAEATTTCADESGAEGAALKDLYKRHTIAHELGHILNLAPEYNRRFGGYHWKAGTGFMMDQSCIYASKKGAVTFYITSLYATASQDSVTAQ